MLVKQTTHSCTACGAEAEYGVEVDLPIEQIVLVRHPVLCTCGYFKERIHDSVSFEKWRVEKRILASRIESCISYLETLNKELKETSIVSEQSSIKRWIGDKKRNLENLRKKDLILGFNPIPDSQFVPLKEVANGN